METTLPCSEEMKTHAPACLALKSRNLNQPPGLVQTPPSHNALVLRWTHKRQTADLEPVLRMMEIFDAVPSDRDQCLARRCSVPGNEISGKTRCSG